MKASAPPQARPENKIVGLIKSILKYPFKVSKRFAIYNNGVNELLAVKYEPFPPPPAHRDNEVGYYRNIQNRYSRFVWGFIYAPIALGVLGTFLMMYLHGDVYKKYVDKLTQPVTEERFVKKITSYVGKVVIAVKDQPMSLNDFAPLFIGYLIGIIGARVCSQNPVFEFEEEIKRRFSAMGCTDIQGNPWRIVWTPEALLIISFGRDPNQLHGDSKFWHSINFPPSIPKLSKKDMNKFVVERKYELSSNMEIKLGAED